MPDHRPAITQNLAAFAQKPLREASLALFSTLGYESDRTLLLEGSKPQAFLDLVKSQGDAARFDKTKALFADWISADLLFQLTDDEISRQDTLFPDHSVKPALLRSYLFFAIELNGGDYPRGKLTAIARQINRVFPMPVMVLLKHHTDGAPVLSIAVINRRQNKVRSDKDVLEKATIIRDISLENPHRGHLDILDSFAFENLDHPRNQPINNFDLLHLAWEKIFNVELLNKNFYEELANWFFWAKKYVHFPLYDEAQDKYDLFKDSNKVREHESKNLIRLLTRTLFVWFIKQRGVVPDSLFKASDLEHDHLQKFDPESKETNYYKAILQNLFFATLNQTHGKREFRKSGQHQNTTTLLRYQNRLAHPTAFLALLEKHTPFLNGGLFDCLDRPHPTKTGPQGGQAIIYEDGFSDRKDNPLQIPDFLFFGKKRYTDLSGDDAFGIPSKRSVEVRGLIHILDNYKFTIIENTPIDQEIALDPELLGQVFENLLASYNPETKTTARKQTGSFYTPRGIVDYMVDESLKAHLTQVLTTEANIPPQDAEAALDLLLAYNEIEKDSIFDESQKELLIAAIDNCKILDPACGSGAFPMGALQKLVHILGKLDPHNQLWKNTQLDKLDSAPMREDLEATFANNDDDYGRKLYLIENCLYGVDIQSIATQVSKLRFFISLIVDQKIDPTRENFNVRPLPNLETKFVTANTLIKIEKPTDQGQLFEIAAVSTLQKKLQRVRHNLFSAKTPATKKKYRQEDETLRQEIAAELIANGWENDAAAKLAAWDPYDQNASAPYFDPEWMFGQKEFDIVIGNPPYVRADEQSEVNQNLRREILASRAYATLWEKWDLYVAFLESSYKLLRDNGITAMIVSDAFCHAKYAIKSQQWFLNNSRILRLDFCGNLKIFEAAVHNVITFFQKADAINWQPRRRLHTEAFGNVTELASTDQAKLTPRAFFPADTENDIFQNKTIYLSEIFYISKGMVVHAHESKARGEFELADLVSQTYDEMHSKPFAEGKNLERWLPSTHRWLEWNTDRAPSLFSRPTFPELYDVPEKLISMDISGTADHMRVAYDDKQLLHNHSAWSFVPWASLAQIRNRSLKKATRYKSEKPVRIDLPKREELEATSKRFSVKFLLAIMNSETAGVFLRANRRSNIHLYPEDWKKLPIPDIALTEQKPIVDLVDQVLNKKLAHSQADVSELEQEMDTKVAVLYGVK